MLKHLPPKFYFAGAEPRFLSCSIGYNVKDLSSVIILLLHCVTVQEYDYNAQVSKTLQNLKR